MADKPKDGGPAFPVLDQGGVGQLYSRSGGMTLRQYYASHAPPPTEQWEKDSAQENPKEHITEIIAAWNFKYADSMLAEQTKPKEK